MLLHLVRHAHALAESENPARPLSARGRAEVGRLARFFATNACFRPAQIWHSPLLRSRETTDELGRRLGWDEAVIVETSGLLPEDDPQEIAERLELLPKDRGDLALIGHEPHLSALAALLMRGKSSSDLFKLRKCAALALELTERTHKRGGLARWRVRWLIAPELLPATTLPLAPSPAPTPHPSPSDTRSRSLPPAVVGPPSPPAIPPGPPNSATPPPSAPPAP